MPNLYFDCDSRWDCLEIHLLPLKRIAWEVFKLIGKEFQNYCMRWVADLFETNLRWRQIDLHPCANLLCLLLIHLAVTYACHILEPSKLPLVYSCNFVIFKLFWNWVESVSVTENWLWQSSGSGQDCPQRGDYSEGDYDALL